MAKTFKFLGILLGTLILLAIIAVIILVTFVSPNRFKPLLEQQIKTFTGRQLTIDGDLSWKIFPTLGVKVGHMVMNNPTGFKEPVFAEISDATVNVKVLPLIHGQIESSGITFDGMKLHLIKNAQGAVNWNFPITNQPAQTQAKIEKETVTANPAAIGLVIANVKVTDSEVQFTNEQTHQNYLINHFELQAKNINLKEPFTLSTGFDFTADKAASGHFDYQSNVILNLAEQKYSLKDIALTLNIKQDKKKIDLDLNGNVDVDMNQQRLETKDLAGQIANMKFDGELIATQLSSTPKVAGKLNIKSFNLKEWLDKIGQPVDALQEAKDVNGNITFISEGAKTTGNGKFTISELEASHLKINNVIANVRMQSPIIYLDSLTGNLYEGTLRSQGKVDLTSTTPKMALQAALSNIQAEPLFKDLQGEDKKLKLTGTGNLQWNITTAGVEKNAILQNLNGTSQFSFVNGSVEGLDIGYLVNNAYALVKRQPMDAENSNKTNFGNLTGTAVIQQGVIVNKDLLMDSPRFTAKGQGNINLVSEKINYQLQATVKKMSATQETGARDLYGISIPISITGNLQDPSIRLDSGALAQSVAQQQLQGAKSKAQEKIEEKIQEKLPGQAGELFKNLLNR